MEDEDIILQLMYRKDGIANLDIIILVAKYTVLLGLLCVCVCVCVCVRAACVDVCMCTCVCVLTCIRMSELSLIFP